MAVTIQIKYSDIAGRVPNTGDLVVGELGINTYDGVLFAKKKQGVVESIIEIGKVTADTSVQDIINVTGNSIFASPFSSNGLVFWDNLQSKLVYLSLGQGLEVSNGELTATGGTDLSYDSGTSTVLSSTGTGAVLTNATQLLPGLQSAEDKVKLDGIEEGATANSTDSALRDRTTHTGTQPFSTISQILKNSILGRYSDGTGEAELLSIGAGLDIVSGSLVSTVEPTSLIVPTGFSVSGNGTSSITISFTTGYSLPPETSQSNWDTAYSERRQWDGGSLNLDASAAFTSLGLGNAATKNVGTSSGTVASGDDSRFSTNLGYNAASRTITSSTGFSATLPEATQLAAGLQSATDKSKLDGIANGATANSTDAQLRDRSTHTGTQSISTLSGISTNVLLGRYSLGSGIAQEVGIGTDFSVSAGSLSIANTSVSAGSYGGSDSVATFQVNSQGRLTSASSVSIQITTSQVSGFNTAVRSNKLNEMANPDGSVSMANQRITNLASPSSPSDAVNLGYINSLQSISPFLLMGA